MLPLLSADKESMWIEILQALMLAQTEQEKKITYFGLIIFGFFLFVLVLDTFSKGKIIPNKGPLKKIVIFMFVVVVIVVILLRFVYK